MLLDELKPNGRMSAYMRGVAVAALFFFMAGCAGRTASPVTEYQYGDDNKSCKHLRAEIAQINNDIVIKNNAKHNVALANIGIFIVGLFFIPIWLAMNVKNANGIEAEALQRRHNALLRYAADKQCGIDEPTATITVPNTETVDDEWHSF